MASYRYRAEIPAMAIGAGLNTGMADVVVFSKPMTGDLELAQIAKKDGAKIVVDFCDDHFDNLLYRDMARIAHKITCPSWAMRDRLLELGFVADVVEDPYEFPITEPHANGPKMLWFGHQTNLDEIRPYLKMPIEVVTGPNQDTRFTLWTPANIKAALAKSNIVLIPDGKKTRSNNRMVNAIAAGCFVIGGKQLGEWKKFVYSGPIHHGLQFAKCFQDDLNGLVKEGQEYIVKKYSPEYIGGLWRDVCASI
jgi:hypothetical protein